MRYLKNLVPFEHKILPDYFILSKSKKSVKEEKSSILFSFVSILFFVGSFFCFHRLLVALLLILIGLLFTGVGKRWIENKGRFRLTDKIRLGTAIGLFFFTLPLHAYYQNNEDVMAKNRELERQRQIKFTADSLLNENNRRDSLHFYVSKLNRLKPQDAFNMLSLVEKFSTDAHEIDALRKMKKAISRKHASALISKKDGKQALFVYEKVLSDFPEDPDVLYDRANYYVKTGNVKAAVADLTLAINGGSSLASKLYNKVNPIRRRVSYYVTRCCDGTTSNAKGRGACSWHGGVCNWNEPVYEEYRKY